MRNFLRRMTLEVNVLLKRTLSRKEGNLREDSSHGLDFLSKKKFILNVSPMIKFPFWKRFIVREYVLLEMIPFWKQLFFSRLKTAPNSFLGKDSSESGRSIRQNFVLKWDNSFFLSLGWKRLMVDLSSEPPRTQEVVRFPLAEQKLVPFSFYHNLPFLNLLRFRVNVHWRKAWGRHPLKRKKNSLWEWTLPRSPPVENFPKTFSVKIQNPLNSTLGIGSLLKNK